MEEARQGCNHRRWGSSAKYNKIWTKAKEDKRIWEKPPPLIPKRTMQCCKKQEGSFLESHSTTFFWKEKAWSLSGSIVVWRRKKKKVKFFTVLFFFTFKKLSFLTLFRKFILLIPFYFLDREREHMPLSGRGKGRWRENLKQAPLWTQSPTQGSTSWLWDHNQSRNQGSETQPAEPPKSPSGLVTITYSEMYRSHLLWVFKSI